MKIIIQKHFHDKILLDVSIKNALFIMNNTFEANSSFPFIRFFIFFTT